jgi:hypothetical protein
MKFYVTQRIGPKQTDAPKAFCRAQDLLIARVR